MAIIGSATASVSLAPFDDPSWEIWIHASAWTAIPQAWIPDRIYDLHPEWCFKEERKNGFRNYYEWLQRQRVPVYMQDVRPEIPASRRYPYERVKAEFPWVLGSQAAAMIAQALMEGVTHIGLWGVHYDRTVPLDAEQRSNCELWVGIAWGRGVQIVIPPQSPLCHEPREDYAFQTHNTPEKYAALKKKFAEAMRPAPINTAAMESMQTDADFARAAAIRAETRPDWVREVSKFGAEEAFPDWILEKERRERDAHARLRQGGAALPDVDGLPGGGAEHRGAAGGSGIDAAGRGADAAAGGAGRASEHGDGVLHPTVRALVASRD